MDPNPYETPRSGERLTGPRKPLLSSGTWMVLILIVAGIAFWLSMVL